MEAQRIFRKKALTAVTGYCPGYIDELIRDGKFPKPIKLGERASGWLESEIAAWQRDRIAERDEKRAA